MNICKKINLILFGIFIPSFVFAFDFKEVPFQCPSNNERYVIPDNISKFVSYYCFENGLKHICPYIFATKEGRIIFEAKLPGNREKCILYNYDENGKVLSQHVWDEI